MFDPKIWDGVGTFRNYIILTGTVRQSPPSLPDSIKNLKNLTALYVGGPFNKVFEKLGTLNQWIFKLKGRGCKVEKEWYYRDTLVYVKDVATGDWIRTY